MTETKETAAEIQEIRFKLEAIEATQLLLVRDRAKDLIADYQTLFAQTSQLDVVYLAIDGTRSQSEIVEALKRDGVSVSQATVSRRMDTLKDHGLIELVARGRRGDIYAKNRVVEQVLRLSKVLSVRPR